MRPRQINPKPDTATPPSRLYYVDNLRIFLISLVVLHHLAITYGAPGGWFYREAEAGFPAILPLTMFVATNQAFFMGMFFFISAYFITPSLERKGGRRFAVDRLVRLGIPTLLFFFVLHPVTVFIRNRYIYGEPVSLWDYMTRSMVWGFGPMWFVEALLLFTFGYLLWRAWRPEAEPPAPAPVPGAGKTVLAALLIGLGQFVIRIWLPVGWAMPFTDFQLPHFLQYIVLFALGVAAYRRRWLDGLTARTGRPWFFSVQLLIFLGFPALFVLGGAPELGTEPFVGGLRWQSLVYAVWEQLVGIGMIVGLFGIFKARVNVQGALAKKLSASAYGVYVFHSPLLLLISLLFLDLSVAPVWKMVLLAPLTLGFCFLVGYLVKKAPVGRMIF